MARQAQSGMSDGRSMLRRGRWRFVMIVAAMVFASFASLAGPAHAQAGYVSCWGDWCSGQDPNTTGCSADAYTVADVWLPGFVAQHLQVRWSPTCKTNWARFIYDPSPVWLKAVQPSTGYTQSRIISNAVNSWTPMIYSPTRCVYAAVQTQTWGAYQTWCV